MNFIEFVAFVITLAAMIFLGIKRFFEGVQQQGNPEEFARKEKAQEENLRKLLRAQGIDLGVREDKKIQKKIVRSQPQPQLPSQSSYVTKTPSFTYDVRPSESYEVIHKVKASSGRQLIESLRTPRDMLVIKEILDKPLSIREY